MKKTTRSRMDDKGFTLVEMIVVLVIIAVWLRPSYLP